ncbi:hypothetical protein [Rhodopirellula sp. MGV]|uniref:hypothetical protein n=1 Tax=Rhodopirellula sp. MGV TaxID=2023130 RepID=UPI000B9669A6|nr:hypothetical protein [Rhodopirellula sp. MGV]OYP37207.1 hypothetical protein CGZ80_05825 [Rhodopirellula sp. MGV]PNY34127.1 hypothetical protein C2E31_24835 [Rhodopirellula baltica]
MEPEKYIRPTNEQPLSPTEKNELLEKYFAHYESIAKKNPQLLNMKLPRGAFEDLLNKVGVTLLEESQQLASSPGPMREFLDATEPPEFLDQRLTTEFRSYCLALNALKQWVSAESAATDRFLLGGTARTQCRKLADHCLVTGDKLEDSVVELHHPVRDGRPPIPLSKAGHDEIEFTTASSDDPIGIALREIKRQGNRSWVMLRKGCMALIGEDVTDTTAAVLASSKTFARKANQASGLTYEALLDWLNENNLGN